MTISEILSDLNETDRRARALRKQAQAIIAAAPYSSERGHLLSVEQEAERASLVRAAQEAEGEIVDLKTRLLVVTGQNPYRRGMRRIGSRR